MGWLYENDAAVLLLGVSYMACTAFHLAEYRLSERRYRNYRCFTIEDRQRCDVEFDDVDLIDSDFAAIGAQMDLEPFVHRGRVGAAGCRLVGIRDAVDFAVIQPLFRWNRMIT